MQKDFLHQAQIKRRLEKIAPVECGTGGQTKFNRTELGLEKDHWIDAACVGGSGSSVTIDDDLRPILIKATGHGTRQFCKVNKYGFPRTGPKPRDPFMAGFQTGDLVKAVITKGKSIGTYFGRISVRSNGYFHLAMKDGIIGSVHSRFISKIMSCDGYAYASIQA